MLIPRPVAPADFSIEQRVVSAACDFDENGFVFA